VLQAAAEATRFNPDHRVGCGIEAWTAVEDLKGDGVGFDPASVPGKGLLDDELQKPPFPFRVHKILAGEDTVKGILNEKRRGRFLSIERHDLCLTVGCPHRTADSIGAAETGFSTSRYNRISASSKPSPNDPMDKPRLIQKTRELG
jgi:hypothetical protein